MNMDMGATQPLQIPQQEIVMVAERAVQQLISDLRGELGVKFHEIENGENGLNILSDRLGDLEDEIQNLNSHVTDALKNNNRLLLDEIKAAKGDISIEIHLNVNKRIDELEKNINISLANIKDNQNKHMGKSCCIGLCWLLSGRKKHKRTKTNTTQCHNLFVFR